MEEVWEGISLSSLHQDVPSTPSSLSATATSAAAAPSSLTSVRGMILQDFLTKGSPKGGRQPSKEPELKPPPPPPPQPQPHGVERQRKRMMHNRESASRSRARKRAYTDELEKEVGRLRSENRALRAQNDKLQKAVEDQLCVAAKRTLQRTLTAPF